MDKILKINCYLQEMIAVQSYFNNKIERNGENKEKWKILKSNQSCHLLTL